MAKSELEEQSAGQIRKNEQLGPALHAITLPKRHGPPGYTIYPTLAALRQMARFYSGDA